MFAVLLAARLPVMKARFDAAVAAAGPAARVAATAGRRQTMPAMRRAVAMAGPPAARAAPAISDEAKVGPAESFRHAVAVRAAKPRIARVSAPPAAVSVARPAPIVAPPTIVAPAEPGDASAAPPAAPASPADFATAAYARLARGDRRGAVRLFDAALTTGDPRAATWRRQRDALTRRWSASAYSIVRDGGPAGLATEPVLGGGQSGASLRFTPDPLSPRPVALTLRGSAGHDDAGRSAFASAGVEWRPVTGVTLAAERRIAIGPAARGDWTFRLAAGVDRTRGRLRLTAYGEGGVFGAATYAAAQGRVAGVVRAGTIAVEPGVGGWASLQHDRATVDRVDLGPGIVARAGRFAAEVDYRVRVTGNAAPGSGPVFTLSANF